MPLDANRTDLTIGVVGTGAMGRGIMQVSAQGGMVVIAFDEKAGAAEAARAAIARTLGGLVEKGRIPLADADAAAARIRVATSLEEVAKADVIVEAIVERLDVKQELFAKLDALAGAETILASNTSSLPISAIAARCHRPERVAGLHFFNPVPLMKLVEVIPGVRTAAWVTDALESVGRRMTREPIRCLDSPGFVVNHVGRAYLPEALRILSEGIGSAADIDRIVSGAPGFRMGPFTLSDLVGLDVGHAVMESMHGQYYGEPAYAASPLMAVRVAGGLLGQKTGEGWYRYETGRRIEPPFAPAPRGEPGPVWVVPSTAFVDESGELKRILARGGAEIETGAQPSQDAIVVLTPLGYGLTDSVIDLKLDAERVVAVDLAFGLKGPRTLMVTPATDPAIRDRAHAMLASDGQSVVVINDSPGFVAQRMVANIVNTGCNIAQRGIAAPADIDKGAKLGLSYPFGPLEWGDRLGPCRVLHILEQLHGFYADPRYRPSPWLKRRAALGRSLLTPEGRC